MYYILLLRVTYHSNVLRIPLTKTKTFPTIHIEIFQEIEIGNWMAASGLNPTDARRMMEEADKKKKGYISREELIESEFCSFFHPEKCMRQLGIRVV